MSPGLPHVESIDAIPALLERLRTRAPDDLYPDTLAACGFGPSEYGAVNGLLYFLNFYLPTWVGESQVISAFWKERYYRRDDHRKALGWMLKLKYGFVYDRAADPMKPTKREVVAAIRTTRHINEDQRPNTEKIADTFLMLHRQVDLVDNDYFGPWPASYIISGVMPRDTSTPTLAKLLSGIKPVWWLVIILLIMLIVRDAV